jgi:hypothetical protein
MRETREHLDACGAQGHLLRGGLLGNPRDGRKAGLQVGNKGRWRSSLHHTLWPNRSSRIGHHSFPVEHTAGVLTQDASVCIRMQPPSTGSGGVVHTQAMKVAQRRLRTVGTAYGETPLELTVLHWYREFRFVQWILQDEYQANEICESFKVGSLRPEFQYPAYHQRSKSACTPLPPAEW